MLEYFNMLKLYNTLSKKKEFFRPRKRKKANLFVCGPTVYDFSHIGHARTYVVFDMIAKYLRQKDYNVFYLQNITDIDDKILARAKKEKTDWKKLSRKFEKEYLKDMKALNINSITKYAPATNYIKEIISQIEILLKKGFAYQIKDGVYYDVSKFKDYGKLSGRTASQAEDALSRIDEAKEKRNKGDFCLWKTSKKGEPKWPSPFGPGRPGWHIEDTAIAEKYFGCQYDIHGGARDLIFPHHEAEIAQMEAKSGKKPLAKYWLHTGFLTVKNKKMAKSLGNFVTIRDFLKKHSPRALRLFILKAHYRSPIDYSEKEIKGVEKQLERIDEFIEKLKEQRIKNRKQRRKTKNLILKVEKEFGMAMDDDFNTPLALALMFNLITQGNKLFDKGKLAPGDARDILKFLRKIDKIFNFIFWGKKTLTIPSSIKNLVKKRERARQEKNWKLADQIRQKIKQEGYLIEDTRQGPKIKRM